MTQATRIYFDEAQSLLERLNLPVEQEQELVKRLSPHPHQSVARLWCRGEPQLNKQREVYKGFRHMP